MRLAALFLAVVPLTYASAVPYMDKRQDVATSADVPESTIDIPARDSSTSPASVSPPTTPVITPEPDTATVSPPTGSSPSPTPSPGVEDDCPPCEDEPLFTSESPSGKACYCLGGGQKGRNNGDKEPWAWGLPACQYGSDGAVCPDICMKYSLMRVLILHLPFMQGLPPSDDDKPQVCSGNGAIPASRECLNSCNFMLSSVNSANPCSQNVVNAANACARCSGANMFVQTGKDATGTFMNGAQVAAKLIDGLQGWCAKPDRCYDLKGGKKISGQGGCPVLAVNNPVQSPSSIVTTSTRSFTDINGRPTFAIEMLTIEDPNFTANTDFAGARPTNAGDTGAASPLHTMSGSASVIGLLALGWLLA